jgi:hypothetical protein
MSELRVIPSSLLRQCPLEGLGVKIPAPINRRVNELCEELEDLGQGDVDKHELVAAILVAATRDPDLKALAEMLLDYHRTQAHEIMRGVDGESAEVMLPAARRGRPPRRQK